MIIFKINKNKYNIMINKYLKQDLTNNVRLSILSPFTYNEITLGRIQSVTHSLYIKGE